MDIEKLIINLDGIYLEEAKKKYLYDTYQKGIEKRKSIHFAVYENATILPVRRTIKNGRTYVEVGVLTSDGDYVEESAVDNLFMGSYMCPNFYTSDKTSAYLGSDHGTWGHFLVNVVPRLWIALEHDSEIDEYVIVRDLESDFNVLFENQIAFFSYLGILDKVRILTVPVRFSKVIVPEASYRYKSFIGKGTVGWYFDEFTKVFDIVSEKALKDYEIQNGNKHNKVFFSRQCNTDGRNSDIGIELLNSFFRNNGYLIVYPENISLAELIYYLNHCEIAAYLSGTLQHNMLFAPQGIRTIAVERRIMMSMYQTDIDLMKKIEATYVSAQFTILPDNFAYSSTYAYCGCLQKFIKKSGMNMPDSCYTRAQYLKKCLIEYLHQYVWSYPIDTPHPLPVKSYYCEVLRDNLDECGRLMPELRLCELENIENTFYWKEKIRDLLILNNISYSLWDEKDIRRFVKTICALIEKNLKKERNKFLLYPYGLNGLIIEYVLIHRYGISPQAIFDNKVSDYNVNVMKLNKIQNYIAEDSCVMLTTSITECREELEKYCQRDMITGPYTVF